MDHGMQRVASFLVCAASRRLALDRLAGVGGLELAVGFFEQAAVVAVEPFQLLSESTGRIGPLLCQIGGEAGFEVGEEAG